MRKLKKYSIGKFAEEIEVTNESVRNWDRTGKLKPAFRNPSGHRYYTQEQVDLYLGLHKPDVEHEKITIGYCRVSSPIVTVFSARLQGKRAHKAKKMVEGLKSDDSDKEN